VNESGAAEGGDRQRPRAVRDSWVSNAADQIQRPTVLRGFVKGRKLWGEWEWGRRRRSCLAGRRPLL